MVLGKFLADVGEAEVGQFPHQVHGHLTRFGNTLALLIAPQCHFVHGVEFADLGNDQAGGGQGVALYLKHIVEGSLDIFQIQGHIVQIPICHDLFHGAFNLTDIVGDVDGNVVAHIIGKVQTQVHGLVL